MGHWIHGSPAEFSCPYCHHLLRGTIAAGARHCPECGRDFRYDVVVARLGRRKRMSVICRRLRPRWY